ncbi:hypothetical protein ARSEF1564_007749 [Beauveria bassiana]
MDPSDDWSQRADSGRGDPAPPLSTPSTPPVAKTRKYQAYVASESGSCQRSGDSPRSEPAEYWDDEEEDDWADDSGDAIGPDDSASIRINRQRQQTRPPPPVHHHSSPPRPQHRFPSVPGPPSSVLSDDEPPYYGPQGHNASRFPHGYRESYRRGVRAHPPVNPPAPLRDRFTRAPALPADGYYAPGDRQTIGYSQPLRYNPGHGQSFGYSHRSAPWYGPRPSYPQSTASGYGSPLRHNSQYPGNLPALGDYFNTGAYPSQGTYYGGDPRGYYGDLRGYYDDPRGYFSDPRGCYSSPAIGEYNTTPYEAGKNPFAPTSSHFNIPPPPPPPPPAEFPTAAPPPPPPMTPPPPPGPRAEEYQTTSSAGEGAAEPAAAVPQAPTCTGLDIQAPQRLTFDPLIAQTASRIVRTIEVTVAPHGLEKPTLAVTEPTAMAWLQPHTICQEDNATTELLAIQALEHFEDGSGRSNVTLVSMPEAVTEAKKETSVIQMRWLHAKRQALSLDYLVRLISHCPSDILSYDLKQVALSLLEDGCQNLQHRVDNGKIIEAGAMLRYTGIYAEDAKKETDPVIFLSVPYLLLKEKTRRVAGQEGFESSTLLQFLYGYVMGDEPEGKQVVNKINRSLARKMVHVPQLWCLLIGPSILVTLADCALTEIQHGGITIDRRRYSARGDSCLVRVTDLDEEEIKFVIPRNCSLLTLTTQLALLVRRKYSLDQFDLLGEDGQPLDSEAWISLMSEAPEEVMMLIRAKGWKEANESEWAQAASQATPSQYGIVPYRQSYRNYFPNMIQSASAQQFMPSYPPPNLPADLYRQPEPYNTSAVNPFSPLRSYHANPFTPMSAAAANPFTPMSAATVTPFTPMSATTANPVVPISSSRAYQTAPPASDNEMQPYRAPSANRKPRRRVFLDIQTLQEELDALRNVIDSQQKLLGNYRDLTAPRLSETMNSARENLYPLESQHIEKLMAGLSQRDFEVRALLGRSQRLREQVKQSIEILEEGHGKAIRVFTIVTLFFLPLSFVSSFFGMNVADIRETKRNQPLFWSIALPVTLGVLAIAFLYGYKWDSMVGWFERLLDGIRESRKSQYKTAADTRVKQPLGLSRGSRQQEGKQTGAQTEKTSQWSWKQVEQDYLRFRMPKRTATSKTIGE